MRTRWSMAMLCALWLAAPAAFGAGFEGLRADDSAPLAIAGEIVDVDAKARSFQVGGLIFRVAPDDPAFTSLRAGRVALVQYEPDGAGFRATRVELIFVGKD